MNDVEKKAIYEQSLVDLDALLEGETDTIAIMASMTCVLKMAFPTYFWAGFYIVKNGALIVGPYQGTVGCLHIPFGKGVCGAAAAQRKTLVVEDVHQFPGHIACDARSNSEIVVPIVNNTDELIAVFDVDSTEKSSFNGVDQHYLELMADRYFRSRQLS